MDNIDNNFISKRRSNFKSLPFCAYKTIKRLELDCPFHSRFYINEDNIFHFCFSREKTGSYFYLFGMLEVRIHFSIFSPLAHF